MTKPTLHWRTEWDNGAPTHFVVFSNTSEQQRTDIERAADQEGIRRDGERWSPPEGPKVHGFFEVARARGFDLDFEKKDEDAPFDLQRLKLEPDTRKKLETLDNFILSELAGFCPVQADGQIDGEYFYFRSRGAYWRMEIGGNVDHTKAPSWWFDENWPSDDGFGAGYLSDEEAVGCILKAIAAYRTEDRSRFAKGHPDYERTILEGWSIGALSLRRAVKRLGITGPEATERAKGYNIELPYTTDGELAALNQPRPIVHGFDRRTGKLVEIIDEDD